MSIYLDNAATTAVCPEAAEAALEAMTVHYGNPSSTHRLGREAKKLLDASRAKIAKALGCAAEERDSTRERRGDAVAKEKGKKEEGTGVNVTMRTGIFVRPRPS